MAISEIEPHAKAFNPDSESQRFFHYLMKNTAQTNTGFSLGMAFDSMPFVLSILIPVMFIGWSLASTTGGIKLFRLLVAFRVLVRIIMKPFLPREEISIFTFNDERLNDQSIRKMLSLIILQGMLVFLSALIFVMYGFEFLPALFEVTSAMSTVGLSTGIVNPALSPVLKCLLIALMWMGRVEIFPVFVLTIELDSGCGGIPKSVACNRMQTDRFYR